MQTYDADESNFIKRLESKSELKTKIGSLRCLSMIDIVQYMAYSRMSFEGLSRHCPVWFNDGGEGKFKTSVYNWALVKMRHSKILGDIIAHHGGSEETNYWIKQYDFHHLRSAVAQSIFDKKQSIDEYNYVISFCEENKYNSIKTELSGILIQEKECLAFFEGVYLETKMG